MGQTGDHKYFQYDVKRYKYWTLRVEEKQRYLGQAVAWLEREGDMQRLSSLTKEERAELWDVVLPEYEKAIEVLWHPDHLNYSWLGNLFNLHKGHGHMHLIPRYKDSRIFAGMQFEDNRWGTIYFPYGQDPAPKEVVLAVRDALAAKIQ